MNLSQQKAVDAALASIVWCRAYDPVAPVLPLEDEIVCQGWRRNAAIAADSHRGVGT
jgi:hypothetical protein